MRVALTSVAGLVLLAGCSSPADVEARHREVLETYHADLAYAQEWNSHTLGIPASGWVAIFLFGSLLLTGLLIAAGVWAYRAQERRARHRHTLEVKQAEVRLAAVKRGHCTVCGADPMVSTTTRGS